MNDILFGSRPPDDDINVCLNNEYMTRLWNNVSWSIHW